nr:reverse transcriptase domain-containing protein [Tanacetum cinerariifolium]
MVIEMVEETMVAPTNDLWRVGLETLTELVAFLTTKFCPSNGIEKLEGEFWNHSMVGADHAGYTDRFHELAKLVPHVEFVRLLRSFIAQGCLDLI